MKGEVTAKAAGRYIRAAAEALAKLEESQAEALAQAAAMIADAIAAGNSIFSFGASHSFMLTEELVYRTGGLMLINPIYPHGMNLLVRPMTLTSQLERLEGLGETLLRNSPAQVGDVLLIASTSGRNAVALDMALAARDTGLKTIGITALEYSQGVTSRHSSGKRLFELVDLVIDNCAPKGDGIAARGGGQQQHVALPCGGVLQQHPPHALQALELRGHGHGPHQEVHAVGDDRVDEHQPPGAVDQLLGQHERVARPEGEDGAAGEDGVGDHLRGLADGLGLGVQETLDGGGRGADVAFGW